VAYTERLLVGYRWYHANNVTPAFSFGSGLSYTMFSYSALRIHAHSTYGVRLSLILKNTGLRWGTEVVQLYIDFPPGASEPPRQLKGFENRAMAPDTEAFIEFTLDRRSISVWDVAVHTWRPILGQFLVTIGSSSSDVRLQGRFTYNGSAFTTAPS
jgi:beta-glucosidase